MKDLAKDDPFELVGVGYPIAIAEETDRQTARCVIEEYALTGFSAADILELFESPIYGLPHAIHRRRGSEFVKELVGEVFGGTK